MLYNQALNDKMSRDDISVIQGAPYYDKKCKRHMIMDDPDDINCTFKPKLIPPLGATKDPLALPDPLMFKPIKTIRHSPMTKSSIDYHYKRL